MDRIPNDNEFRCCFRNIPRESWRELSCLMGLPSTEKVASLTDIIPSIGFTKILIEAISSAPLFLQHPDPVWHVHKRLRTIQRQRQIY